MSANASNAPVASVHVFVVQLSQQAPQTKVRFLCCVLDLDEKTGYILVEHRYPRRSTNEVHQAYVGIDNVLETAKKDIFVLGAWINVIGYVLERDRETATAGVLDKRPDMKSRHLPRVQAIMVWSAGAVHVEEYEKVIQKTIDLRLAQQGKRPA